MKESKITNLKDFIGAYGQYKSDVEISRMLEIPVDQVKSERRKFSFQTLKAKIERHQK